MPRGEAAQAVAPLGVAQDEVRRVDDQDKLIVITPNVASGRPIISGTGIRVEAIWNRFEAGDTVEELVEDYGIEPRVIKKAISYLTDVKAA